MVHVTLQVVDGFEKGRVFDKLSTPVTIGREEDNTIQLNDERVSRFHVKIQEEGGRVILTDLDSTNGTRVNGHPVQMRVLQVGDQLLLGHSLLLFGSTEQIAEVLRMESKLLPAHDCSPETLVRSLQKPLNPSDDELVVELFPQGPPDLPGDLRPVQTALLSDLLAYIHDQIGRVVESSEEQKDTVPPVMETDWSNWQRLVGLQMQLASYLRQISEPGK